jgi:hypothetical protein
MTVLSDKLPALSGIVSLIHQRSGDDYFAGIWGAHFIEDLLWRVEDPKLDSYVLSPKTPFRPPTWRAPSWSFAAIEGVVKYQEFTAFGPYCGRLEKCTVVPAGQNLFGELQSGFAQISAPITSILDIGKQPARAGIHCRVKFRHRDANANIFFDVEAFDECQALMLAPYTGLAVIRKGPAGYVRIGAFQVHNYPEDPPLSNDDLPQPTSITLM